MDREDCQEEPTDHSQDNMKCPEEDLPPDIAEWTKHQVRKWALKLDNVGDSVAEKLFEQDICGSSLVILDTTDLVNMGVTFGPAKLLIHARDQVSRLEKEEPSSSTHQPGRPCKPYPFCRYHDTYRYMESGILDITESGALDLIEPCHEYKSFTSTTEETKMIKFTEEVIRFAAACMNSRTNGTIHFGIADNPHGQVLGVVVEDKEAYAKQLKAAIDDHFEHKHKQAAQTCIRTPRFVEVLNMNMTSSDKFVIEVDVVPDSATCEENHYHICSLSKKEAKRKNPYALPPKLFYIRDGGSSSNLHVPVDTKLMKTYKAFLDSVAHRSQLRKKAEEEHLCDIRCGTQGSRLSQMITGGSLSLDKSHFEQYVIVTNKSHSSQFESLGFLLELNPISILDFDPESAEQGLLCYFNSHITVNPHLPKQYKITDGVEETADKLKLNRNTSWVFCNGGIEKEAPSDLNRWLMEKGASVRDVISFLCRKDVLPNKRFLVIFMLLSTVSEKIDPLLETFSAFCQELKGTNQILCICDSKNAFTSWKDLIEVRCEIDISDRCIYELSFAEVNGTVLSLLSKNRRAKRFLPCGGESKVLLNKKMECSLTTLDVLCVNQCEGGNEDKVAIEENFYRGGKVSWWNFYFSEEPGSSPFIKRDKFDFIMSTVLPDLGCLRNACVLLNLMHVPGCGGTTLGMHILWTVREKYRCALLKDKHSDFYEVVDQVLKLLMFDHEEHLPRIPVLLMLDDFDEMEKVFELQQLIEKTCAKKDIQSKSAQVILLNCMRSECPESMEPTSDRVFIGNILSDKEQRLFNEKLVEIKATHKNVETFYGFMIMKKNFNSKYVKRVVHNTLRSFNVNDKHAKLLAVLILLNVYCKGASLSISLCEEFLDLQPKPVCGTIKVEEQFGIFSTLISRCLVFGQVAFTALEMIHSRFAKQCLEELETTHKVNKGEIAHILLSTDEFYESTQGKDKLLENIYHILVKRYYSSQQDSHFSPLIQDIAKKTPGLEEIVLESASKRFKKDAVIAQLLARYYYLKKKDFAEARKWSGKARELSKDSSYMADTAAQVIKHELQNAIANYKQEYIIPETMKEFLKMAQLAMNAFQETLNLARKESVYRLQVKRDNSPFNTSGCLGQIQVGVLIIEVLAKSPIFSLDNVRHDLMSEILSGHIQIHDLEMNDPQHKHKPYYVVLRQFESVLCNLRNRMKLNFNILDHFFVNLDSRFGMKDNYEQVAQRELVRCYSKYARLFCRTDSKSLLMDENLKVHYCRQVLEEERADTYSGILNLLLSISDETEKMEKITKLERIVKAYCFVCNNNPTLTEKINFIYVNVVLSCFKLQSSLIQPYQKLLYMLCRVLQEQIPLKEYLPLYFIAVVLLWPAQCCLKEAECRSLGRYISQMKTSYRTEMKEIYNGKRPVVHFFLGKKQGYQQLVPLGEIKRCIKAEQEQFASVWGNGTIWKEKMVRELLLRVTGEVNLHNNSILADTCIPDQKIEVAPLFRSQLYGNAQGSKVSFFVGFTINGPFAFDIS